MHSFAERVQFTKLNLLATTKVFRTHDPTASRALITFAIFVLAGFGLGRNGQQLAFRSSAGKGTIAQPHKQCGRLGKHPDLSLLFVFATVLVVDKLHRGFRVVKGVVPGRGQPRIHHFLQHPLEPTIQHQAALRVFRLPQERIDQLGEPVEPAVPERTPKELHVVLCYRKLALTDERHDNVDKEFFFGLFQGAGPFPLALRQPGRTLFRQAQRSATAGQVTNQVLLQQEGKPVLEPGIPGGAVPRHDRKGKREGCWLDPKAVQVSKGTMDSRCGGFHGRRRRPDWRRGALGWLGKRRHRGACKQDQSEGVAIVFMEESKTKNTIGSELDNGTPARKYYIFHSQRGLAWERVATVCL